MPKALVVDKKNYLPSAHLARRFSYTSDYLGKLARDGKVDATKVGRQWYVNEESLSQFVAAATEAKAERSVSLRQERIIEREQFVKQQVTPISSSTTLVQDVSTLSPFPVGQTIHSLAQSVIVMACGLLVGLLGYVVYQEEVQPPELAAVVLEVGSDIGEHIVPDVLAGHSNQLAMISFAELWNRLFFTTEETTPLTVSPQTNPSQQHEITHQPNRSALLMLDARTSTTSVAEIKKSFSDEVEVEFDGPDTGTLRPVFKKPTEESYRFLLVPVVEASNS